MQRLFIIVKNLSLICSSAILCRNILYLELWNWLLNAFLPSSLTEAGIEAQAKGSISRDYPLEKLGWEGGRGAGKAPSARRMFLRTFF